MLTAVIAVFTINEFQGPKMVNLEKVGNLRAVMCNVNGEDTVAILEPMNFGTSILSDSELLKHSTMSLSIGDLKSNHNVSSIPISFKTFESTVGKSRYDLVLGQESFEGVIICVDYINEQTGFILSKQDNFARRWLEGSGQKGQFTTVKLTWNKSNLLVTDEFESDGSKSVVAPFLYDTSTTMNLESNPRTLDGFIFRKKLVTNSGNVSNFDIGLWRGVRFAKTDIPLFLGSQLDKSGGENTVPYNSFSLSSLGVRRIYVNTATNEIGFIKPSLKNLLEGILRSAILNFPVFFDDDQLFVGRMPELVEGSLGKQLNGSRVISIGDFLVSDFLEALESGVPDIEAILVKLVKHRSKDNLAVEVLKNGDKLKLNITPY